MTRTALTIAFAATAPFAAADFATDFGVASDGMGNLAVEFNFDNIAPISNFIENGGSNGDFTGWFSDEPGFANFEEDEADEGLFIVPDGTVVAFRLLSADPAFAVYDPEFETRLNVGDSFVLGSVSRDAMTGEVISGFDDHPWWTVESDAPGFDPGVFTYTVSFELFDARDDGIAGLNATGPITVEFTRIPAPGTAALLGLAGLASVRRR